MQGWAHRARGVWVLANTPRSVFSPLPTFAFSLFFLYQHPIGLTFPSLAACASGIAFSLFSVWGANIWNNVSDLSDDIAAGRVNALTTGDVSPSNAIVLAASFYAMGVLVSVFGFSMNKAITVILALAFCVVTFLYSWNEVRPLSGKRLKEHWAGEVLVYAVAIPTHTLALTAIYSPIDARALAISIPIFSYLFTGLLLKDIKDISSDSSAGYRTLGVEFSAASLIRGGFALLLIFYAGATVLATMGIVGRGGLLVLICLVIFLLGVVIPLYSQRWKLTITDGGRINLLAKNTYAALLLWGLGSALG